MFGITAEHLMGKGTVHVPVNFIVQSMGDDGTTIGVFQTRHGNPLRFGSKMTHQLVLGDAMIRPHLVAESEQFVGSGIDHLTTQGFAEIDKWVEGVIYARDEKFRAMMQRRKR